MPSKNYDLTMLAMLDAIGNDIKPTLLLHTCCAPCCSGVLEQLRQTFEITVYFYNPNIFPREEYELRLNETKIFLNNFDSAIPLVAGEYDSAGYDCAMRGHENEPEGSARCSVCFCMRLEQAAHYASEHQFDYFATTLTISPHKNPEIINEIGLNLQKKYNSIFLVSDFKKRNGYKHSIEMSEKFHIYRQNYCGCQVSMQRRTNKWDIL
ncbi:MAG: epoxyqueuosine reductase QueH [Clostridia bacterium]